MPEENDEDTIEVMDLTVLDPELLEELKNALDVFQGSSKEPEPGSLSEQTQELQQFLQSPMVDPALKTTLERFKNDSDEDIQKQTVSKIRTGLSLHPGIFVHFTDLLQTTAAVTREDILDANKKLDECIAAQTQIQLRCDGLKLTTEQSEELAAWHSNNQSLVQRFVGLVDDLDNRATLLSRADVLYQNTAAKLQNQKIAAKRLQEDKDGLILERDNLKDTADKALNEHQAQWRKGMDLRTSLKKSQDTVMAQETELTELRTELAEARAHIQRLELQNQKTRTSHHYLNTKYEEASNLAEARRQELLEMEKKKFELNSDYKKVQAANQTFQNVTIPSVEFERDAFETSAANCLAQVQLKTGELHKQAEELRSMVQEVDSLRKSKDEETSKLKQTSKEELLALRTSKDEQIQLLKASNTTLGGDKTELNLQLISLQGDLSQTKTDVVRLERECENHRLSVGLVQCVFDDFVSEEEYARIVQAAAQFREDCQAQPAVTDLAKIHGLHEDVESTLSSLQCIEKLMKGNTTFAEQHWLLHWLRSTSKNPLWTLYLIYGYLKLHPLKTDLSTLRFIDMIVAFVRGDPVSRLVDDMVAAAPACGPLSQAYASMLQQRLAGNTVSLAEQLAGTAHSMIVTIDDRSFACDHGVVYVVHDGDVVMLQPSSVSCKVNLVTHDAGFGLVLRDAPVIGDWESSVSWDHVVPVTTITGYIKEG